VPTIAYSIATAIPYLRKAIGKVVARDPAVVHKDCSTQFTKLILEPLRSQSQASSTDGDNPFLIVIDGLDECADWENQREILENILNMTANHLHVRFIVLSRPEPHIKNFFHTLIQNGDVTVTPVFSIDDHHSAIEDVYTFLRNKLDDLSRMEKHLPALNPVPRPWPPDKVVRDLAYRSGGYFIYASTLLRYIDDEFSPCTKKLDGVVRMCSTTATPFAELDKLYTEILSTCPDRAQLLLVLGCLLLLRVDDTVPSVEKMELVLGLQWPGEALATLRGLHSVITFEPQPTLSKRYPPLDPQAPLDSSIRPVLIHASFTDFLLDETRSKSFFIDREKYMKEIISHSLESISSQVREMPPKYVPRSTSPCSSPTARCFSSDTTVAVNIFYLFSTWMGHFHTLSNPETLPFVEYIRKTWTTDFWISFLCKSRGWPSFWRGQLLGVPHDMSVAFEVDLSPFSYSHLGR